jgi:hypothetical protein
MDCRGDIMKEPVNPRQFALDAIARLPEAATLEDLREEFEIVLGLLESIRDEEAGRLIPHEQVVAELNEWLSNRPGRPQPAAT